MPLSDLFWCCKSGDAIDRSVNVANTAASAPPLSSSHRNAAPPPTPTPITSDNNPGNDDDDDSTTEEERKLAESVFYDARQDLTKSMMVLSQMPYHPATSSIKRHEYSLDDQPEGLLLLDDVDEEGEEEGDSKRSKSAPPPAHVVDSVAVLRKDLQLQPTLVKHGQDGYPGNLTPEELESTLELRRFIKEQKISKDEPTYYEMVHAFDGVEPEAFALCRYMRSRKFELDELMTLMETKFDTWKEGKVHDYYRKDILEKSLPNPMTFPVLITQLPVLQHGIAKNGSMVAYFQGGRISIEAIDCLVDMEQHFGPYFWNMFMHRFKQNAIKLQQDHPEIEILFEVTIIIDLKGIHRSLFSDRVMKTMKTVCKVFDCFPEVLSKMIFLNAPFFFSAIWMVIKQFLDPRTVQKVSIFSNQNHGMNCISEYVETSELLSDYGNNNNSTNSSMSFDEVLEEYVVTNTEENKIKRHIVERFFFSHGKSITYNFDLPDNEKISEILVYTRSTAGAVFTIGSSGGGGEAAAAVLSSLTTGSINVVSPSQTTTTIDVVPPRKDGSKPYMQKIASNLTGRGHVIGTAKYNKSASKKEYFLVVIRIV